MSDSGVPQAPEPPRRPDQPVEPPAQPPMAPAEPPPAEPPAHPPAEPPAQPPTPPAQPATVPIPSRVHPSVATPPPVQDPAATPPVATPPPSSPSPTAPPTPTPPVQQPPTPQPPTPQSPAHLPPTQPLGHVATPAAVPQAAAPPVTSGGSGKKTAALVGGGLLLVAALGLGGLVAFSSDDDPVTAPTSTTVVGEPTTTVAEETTTTAAVPRTVAELATSTVMLLMVDSGGQPLCSGSGTIVEADGTILTNAHVVAQDGFCPYDSIVIAVTDDSGVPPVPTYEADLLAVDQELDLAVVRATRNLDGSPTSDTFVPTAIGDSDTVQIGDNMRILGYPGIGGETITFTNGSVSGFTAQVGVGDRSWIKTDATIAGGNSGGTAVNDEGELIGIPTQGGASSESPIVDCRVITDTNGDGVVNQSDQCVPFGGFLNGIRPVNLALPLLEMARTADPMTFAPEEPAQSVEVSDLYFSRPGFSLGVAETESDTQFVVTASSADTELCFWVDWEGMVPGAQWDAVWFVNDEINEDYSFFNQFWEGDADGSDFWVCVSAPQGFSPGLYEIAFFVEGEIAFIEAIEVTPAAVPVYTVEFVNQTGGSVCYLAVNPIGSSDVGLDELGRDEILDVGTSKELLLPEGTMIAEAYDCDGNPVSSALEGLTIVGDDIVTMAPN